MKYTITITFKHFDSKPLVIQSDNMLTASYDAMRRTAVYNNGYPNMIEILCDDVLSVVAVANK